jgi:hypothetical protein
MKSMEPIEFLTLLFLNRELLGLPLELPHLEVQLLQRCSLLIIFSQHLIKLLTKQQNIDTDQEVNLTVEA